MKVEILNESSLSVVQIIGRMDATTVSIFDEKAKEIYGEKENVLLDLKALEFISSAGLRSLLTVAKAIQKEGRTLAFINLAPMVADVFKMAGFLSILKVYPDKVSAAKELGA